MAGPTKRAQKKSGARGVYSINRGDPITADYLNRVGDAAALVVGRVRAPQRIAGDEIEPQPELSAGGEGGGLEVQQLNFFAWNGTDKIACLDGGGAVVIVAIPWNLAFQNSGGGSRVVSGETQFILPTYADEPKVLAANVGATVTGITGVDWIDMNIAGRMWVESLQSL